MKNEGKNVQAAAYNGVSRVHDFHKQKMVVRVGAEFTFWLSMSQPVSTSQRTRRELISQNAGFSNSQTVQNAWNQPEWVDQKFCNGIFKKNQMEAKIRL